MNDLQTQALLHEVLRRESRSLLTYVGEAALWTASDDEGSANALTRIVAEHKAAVAGLARFLVKHRLPPAFLGSYPAAFTSIHFLAVDHLLPRLLAAERHSRAELEYDLARVAHPEARRELEKLLAVKQAHLAELEEWVAPPVDAAPPEGS